MSDPFREIWCSHSLNRCDGTSAYASPARLLDWVLPVDSFLPALGSVALSLDTGEINLGGSIFCGRCGGGRLRAIHGRCPEVVTRRCRSYAIGAVGLGAWRPPRTRTPCERLADRMPVTTREASALNLTPSSAVFAAAGVWSSTTPLPV